ncbi:MAG: Uma2 family endonuclease [Microcystis panniformis Mp_MB_F_20080800_S26D]|nr:MAG: Uma2 family endonuclease [Microcystis panniformis Mp_MB_F_20080800_S26D]
MSLSLITRKLTVEEYEKMATEGIIKPDEKVELIRGEIIKMSPMGTRHDLILLGVQNPIRLNNNSQPEPDLSLLIPRSDFYVAAYPCPQDIYLIIEVPLHGSYQDIQKYYRGESIFIESFPAIKLTLIEILGNKSEIKG